MARAHSYSGDLSDLPPSVRRAAAVDRSFHSEALCRTDTGIVRWAWIADPKLRYQFGTQKVKGEVLNRWALEVCRTCPVQWECALAAIEADERAGIWADTLDNLRKLSDHPEVIERARIEDVPVQEAVRRVLADIG